MAKYNIGAEKENAEKGHTLVPVGQYLCRVEEVAHHVSEDQKESWRVNLTVTEGAMEGETIRDTFFFSQKALVRVFLFLTATGVPEDRLGSIDTEEDVKLAIGRPVIVDVVHSVSKKDGNTYANPSFRGYKAVAAGPAGEQQTKQADSGIPF